MEWISVKDKLPEDCQSVFTFCPEALVGYEVTNSIYQEELFSIVNGGSGIYKDWNVTHWCAAPDEQPINQDL